MADETKPCGSCGEPGPYRITLRGVHVPVCLRHYNIWRPPADDYTCPTGCVVRNHPGREHAAWLSGAAADETVRLTEQERVALFFAGNHLDETIQSIIAARLAERDAAILALLPPEVSDTDMMQVGDFRRALSRLTGGAVEAYCRKTGLAPAECVHCDGPRHSCKPPRRAADGETWDCPVCGLRWTANEDDGWSYTRADRLAGDA